MRSILEEGVCLSFIISPYFVTFVGAFGIWWVCCLCQPQDQKVRNEPGFQRVSFFVWKAIQAAVLNN